jgi:small subunit ribosomal protein S21|tara:strand:+ start:322 stop:513 length:192 start_codon:yes stop_codon:yes gene_type:complete
MLKVNVKKGNIERALKELKSKFIKTKVARHCRDKQDFTKPSVTRRDEINKAKYVQQKKDEEGE